MRPAQFAMETARSIKSLDEIELIRRSVAVADAAIAHLRATVIPGMTENEVWSTFTSHAFAQGVSMSNAGCCRPVPGPTHGFNRRPTESSNEAIWSPSTPI